MPGNKKQNCHRVYLAGSTGPPYIFSICFAVAFLINERRDPSKSSAETDVFPYELDRADEWRT